MRPDLFLATIGRGSNGSNALEITEDRAAVTAESQDNIINRVNNVSQYGPSWHYVPGIGAAGTAYAEVPGSALGDLAFTRASSKTRTNSAGVVETIGNNVPPHDYRNADGTLSTFPRLNLEPQRTNSIRNSSMVGAVAGTPGTLPTNWITSTVGLTQTVVGIGTENGLPYIDMRFNGTASSTNLTIGFESVTGIVASNAQTWANSFYSKVIAQPNPPVSYNLNIIERTSAGSIVAEGNALMSLTSSLNRFSFVRTLSGGATVERVQPRMLVLLVTGQTYDFTIRIAAPQMELGGYATTWVPTTTAAVTRLVDLASKTGVSSIIGQTEGTLFAEFTIKTVSEARRIFSISDGSISNRIVLAIETSNQFRVLITNGGVQQFSSLISATNGTNKLAVSYKANDFSFYLNGAQVFTQLSGSVPLCSDVYLGKIETSSSSLILADGVAQAALFPTRLTNAELAQLTTL